MPNQAAPLTKKALDKLRQQAEADPDLTRLVADGGQRGLYARARRGKVEFIYRYRPPGGAKRRHLRIDDYGTGLTLEQAREAALRLRGQVVVKRVDPIEERAEKQKQTATVDDAVKGYLKDFERRAKSGVAKRGKMSSFAGTLRCFERDVLPVLGKIKLSDLTAADVRQLHRAKTKTAPVGANRMLTQIKAAWNWAVGEGLVPAGTQNPVDSVEENKETGRRRALSADELRRLGDVLHVAENTGRVTAGSTRYVIHPSAVLAVRLLALTGMRPAEVLGGSLRERRTKHHGLRWGDVDLDRGLVFLHDTKAGEPQVRVLGVATVELLRAARPEDASNNAPVCPGTIPDQPFAGMGKARTRLWAAAGIAATPDGRADLYSLRHTYASTGAHLADGRFVGAVSALLGHGHQAKAITQRYITSNPEALRPAADAIAGEIARLLGLNEPGDVVEFPARAEAG